MLARTMIAGLLLGRGEAAGAGFGRWIRGRTDSPATLPARAESDGGPAAGLLATVNVLVLLTAATQLNSQYLFFTSWTDLMGSTTGAVSVTALGAEHRPFKPPANP